MASKMASNKTNIKKSSSNNHALLDEMAHLAEAAQAGHLTERADVNKVEGDSKILLQRVNEILDTILIPIGEGNRVLAQISSGKIDELIIQTYKGDHEKMKQAINNVAVVLQDLKKEVNRLTCAALDGQLSERGKADQFKSAFGEIVQSVNTMLDAILLPIGEGNRVLKLIKGGNLREKVEIECKGDHKAMKDAINGVHTWLSELVVYVTRIANGDVKNAKMEKASSDDQIHEWLMLMQANINILAQEMEKMAAATAVGNLDFRADISKVKGDFAEILNGANRTVQGAAIPTKDIGNVLDKMAAGETKTRCVNDYKGMYNTLKIASNGLAEQLQYLSLDDGGAVLQSAAEKNMTKRLQREYKGDLGRMKDNINLVIDSLDQALTQVAEATEQVSSGSQQIAAGSQSLAQGANEQASSLEEVSSSLEEMSSMTKQNAENANQAKNLAGEADGKAKEGTEAMTRMSLSINKIKESSDQTAKIVKTIDEIAMQTNLLALNAAVEAARAGEAGRGFAVVAEEVRNLAQRSAQAAKNTADMISESVKNAEDGVKIATEVSKSFEGIAGGVKKVNDLIAEIAAASGEQSQGIDQVNTAVAEMDKVTQQNAANSEESASAAEEMSSQAEELQSMIAQFSLSSVVQKKTGPVHSQVNHSKPAVHQKPAAPKFETKLHHNGKIAKPMSASKANAEAAIPMHEDALKEF